MGWVLGLPQKHSSISDIHFQLGYFYTGVQALQLIRLAIFDAVELLLFGNQLQITVDL